MEANSKMANTVIQLKYSNVTSVPPLLNIAEPAYSNVSNKLFINDGSGVVAIGGKYFTELLDNATSANTANTIVRRSTSGNIDANIITASQFIDDGVDVLGFAQSAFNTANNAVGGTATDGFARNTANAASSYANSAYTQANTATTNAATADQRAVTSGSYANSAYDQANTATTNAATADQRAVTSGSYANSAYEQANTATLSAQSGYNQANTGTQYAQSAGSYANGAFALANTKFATSGGSITGNVQIDGNLTVSGTTTTVHANNMTIQDNMIYLNADANVANPDLGIAAAYNDGTYQHTGLFRDASDGVWKFYDGYLLEPDASIYIDTSDASFKYATIKANLISDVVSIRGYDPINHANGAYGVANSASAHATSGYVHANSAFAHSNLTLGYAESGYAKANTASIKADASYEQANIATTSAETAGAYANAAFATANNALVAGGQIAGGYANSAYLQANTATQYATSAGVYANASYTQANTATVNASAASSYANSAYTQANSAYNQANTATTNAATADQKAVSAGSYANSAYSQANTATTNASVADQRAVTSGSYANSAYNQANTGTILAQAAFDTANTKLNSAGGTISGSLTVAGDLFVSGNTVSIDTSTVRTDDSLIKLAANNVADLLDIGFYGQYNDGSDKFSGLVRDASDGVFKLFTGETTDPTGNVVSYSAENRATLEANFTGGNVSGLFNAISVSDGGLGVKTIGVNHIIYGDGTNPVKSVGSSTEGHVLQISSSGAPVFEYLNGGTF
jgi:hypothetical protein